MDAHTPEKEFCCLDEVVKGCVRIRLYVYPTDSGRVAYLLELVAWNAWAGQGKLIVAAGGLDRELAREGFAAAMENVRTYSWMEGELVFEERL